MPQRILSNGRAVRTNLLPRATFPGDQLSDHERKYFPAISDKELPNVEFFRYRGMVYSVGQFEKTGPASVLAQAGWKGLHWQAEARALLIGFPKDNIHWVVVGEITP